MIMQRRYLCRKEAFLFVDGRGFLVDRILFIVDKDHSFQLWKTTVQ